MVSLGGLSVLLPLALLHCLVLCTEAKNCDVVLEQNFNSYKMKKGQYRYVNTQDLKNMFRPKNPRGNYIDNGRVLGRLEVGGDHGKAHQGVARVRVKEGCIGAKTKSDLDGKPCGVNFRVTLPKPLQSATLSYWVKFSKDYDWTRGGKLPGLSSNDYKVGCNKKKEGWSHRVMWRCPRGSIQKGSGTCKLNTYSAPLVNYLYHPDKNNKKDGCGMDEKWGDGEAVKSNGWFHLRVYIKMNTLTSNGKYRRDGKLRVWKDGRKVDEISDMLWVKEAGHEIRKFIFHVYHGGKKTDKRFSPRHGQFIWLDDIKLQEGLCTPQDDKTSMETLAGLRGGISIASHSEEVDQDHQRYTGSLWSSDEDEYVYDEDEAVDIYADDEDDEDEEVEEDEEDIDIYTDDIDYEPETRKHHDVNELGEGDNSQPTDAGEVQHALMDSMASFSGHLTAEIEDSRS